MSASDVTRRIAAFEFASRASDLIFGNVYALPRVPRPSVRDRENPMERYNDGQFLARYRFTKGTVRELLAMLPLQASADNSGLPLPPMLQLLVTLRFYGAGALQIVTGDLVNVSQPTVCRTVGVVTRLIARHLFKELVHFPDASQLNTVMREFFEMARFPGVTGCIDCTHVRINSSGGDDAEVYRNRKGVFSIDVQHKPGRSASIVTACAALHNLACLRGEPQPPPPPPPPVRRRVRNNRRRARRPVHLPPVDAVEDTLTGIQTREIIIEKSFTY
ncbi:hypothetical protein HPB47_005341 [Ixodes persulcatus]|uniref:Uncharacterized protein n=1 Tax=Ixodes persulcatus TaxID=34615 RepID=A0AC60PD89_IXOPE|nr:hypothetical protein HPB47_005341 [Ixodes persulcatus]